ncbi:outer membrane beta-barrel protein [Mucilaginibacter antarcticus]|uniref:Outer membrane beta-barrel protein n=1 Tax=Mucilaginibacter antarcticus TaxID=1855725 RepID=A0ABW5XKY1_9SPHI
MKTTLHNIYTLLILLLCTGTAFAQTSSAVSGKLVDDKGVPISYASVSLLNAADSAVVKGTLTTDAGIYKFDAVKPGSYIIKANSVGYTNAASAVVTMSGDKGSFTVPAISMKAASKTLNTVTITSSKPLIERKIDRTVINVENSLLAAGNNALEILERAPGVTVDNNDNISLKGKQGVMVMINDKLTYLSATQLATLLRSTDGNTVQSIEIITNPSAKYDAAGNSGIINIKLKKNKQAGTNGSLAVSVGKARKWRDNLSLSLNHKEGDVNLFGTFSHGDNPRYRDMSINRTIKNGTNNIYFDQMTRMPSKNSYNSFKIGADWDITPNNTLGLVVSGYTGPGVDDNFTRTNIGSQPGLIDSFLISTSIINSNGKNLAVNFNDRLKLDTVGQTLSFDLDYSRFRNNNDAEILTNYFLSSGGVQHAPLWLRNQTPAIIDVYSAKADYAKPLNKTMKFETGAKFSSVKTDNDLRAQISNGGPFVNDTARSNRFVYTEKIAAAYTNFNKQYTSGSIQLGLRAEYTQSNGNLLGSTSVNRSYLNLFPSLFFNKTLSPKNDLSFSYSRRIDRPNYQDLNPFVYYLDPYTYSAGNAFLKPQYTHNLELAYSYNKTVNITLGYSHTTDASLEIIITQGNKTFQTIANVKTQKGYSVDIFSPYSVFKWWTGNVNFNGFYAGFKSADLYGGAIDNGRKAFVFKTTQNLLFGSYKAEIMAEYRSSLTYGIYEIRRQYGVSAAVGRAFFDKKINIKVGLDDVFNTRRNDISSNELANNFVILQKRDTRYFKFNVTYNFGNAKIKQRERRTGAEEEKSRAGGGN